jgi:hypothetical protein
VATALYDAGRGHFATGDIDWVNDDIRAVLVDADYTVNLATDNALDDIPAGGRLATSGALTTSQSNGICDVTDFQFNSVAGGGTAIAVVYFKYVTGDETVSWLIAYVDNSTGLPLSTNGNNVLVTIDNGSNKLFKL